MTSFLQSVVDAIAFGSIYSLYALGIALIFGVMRLVNFAHGELIMVGAYALVWLADVPVALRVVATIAVVVVVALAMERAAFRPVRDANPVTLLVTSFALSLGLQNLAFMIAGATPKSTSVSESLSHAFIVGDLVIPAISVLEIVTAAVLVVALVLFLGRTRLGLQMRAAAEDFTTSRILGVRANTVIATAFAISGLLAAVAAVLLVAQTGQVTTTIGVTPVLIAFVATIVGGLGSLQGAVLGSYLLGAVTVAFQEGLPPHLQPYRDAFVFGAVLLMLVARPQGLIVTRAQASRV